MDYEAEKLISFVHRPMEEPPMELSSEEKALAAQEFDDLCMDIFLLKSDLEEYVYGENEDPFVQTTELVLNQDAEDGSRLVIYIRVTDNLNDLSDRARKIDLVVKDARDIAVNTYQYSLEVDSFQVVRKDTLDVIGSLPGIHSDPDMALEDFITQLITEMREQDASDKLEREMGLNQLAVGQQEILKLREILQGAEVRHDI